VAHRREFGHWEGDFMLFKQKLGQTNVTTLVERVSRFTVILKNPNRRTKPVMGKIIQAIKDLPQIARRSITFDRGSEFMNWPHLQAEIHLVTIPSHDCHNTPLILFRKHRKHKGHL
jgi:IS30 family transposase